MVEAFDHEGKRIDAYFNHLLAALAAKAPSNRQCLSGVVLHMLPNVDHFVSAINQIAPVRTLFTKTKSRSAEAEEDVDALELPRLRKRDADRVWEHNPNHLLDILEKDGFGGPFILSDIGGYFAGALDLLYWHFGSRLRGVMEGTENGVLEYQRVYASAAPPVPVVSVARSPLKLPEDYLVGSSIAFSVERLLRQQGQILQTRVACVIGFGKVGRAVAAALRGRGITTLVHDKYPIPRAEAAAQGYQVFSRLEEALSHASLVISATSNNVLDKVALADLRNGAAVASVTSQDSEFTADALDGYDKARISRSQIWRYDERGGDRYFWLLNDGNAPNFLDGAVLGPALELIEGEKLTALHALATEHVPTHPLGSGPLLEVSREDRERVARIWNEHFVGS